MPAIALNVMATITTAKSGVSGEGYTGAPQENNLLFTVLKYFGLMVLNAFALILIYSFAYDRATSLAIVVAVVTVLINVVVFVPSLLPVRWITPGLVFVILLAVYPIFFTVTTAFTNYGDGHRLEKDQAIRQILTVGGNYIPENAPRYRWGGEVFAAEDGTYALWLTRDLDGRTETILAPINQPVIVIEDAPAEVPETFQGFTQLSRRERGPLLSTLNSATFGADDFTLNLASSREAAALVRRYVYDAETGTIIDQSNGTVYEADDEQGLFIPRGGTAAQALQPGFRSYVGLENFERFLTDPSLRGPLVNVFAWTVMFAALSVLTTFALGLVMAMILNDPVIPARKAIRSVLLIPYAIPGVISIVVWRGMLNQNLGIVNDLLGTNIFWLNDPFWAKFSLVFVNLWLGYPYMMLICSGALQSIPSEVYEAASVDGANPWQKFWNITLPLLLVAVGPLLIGSFTFNFNNYLLITALTGGNPPFLGSPVPAGQTDILISYVYKSAFSNQADYGYASAITIVIFFIVATVTLIQFRFTRTLEQVSENV